MCAPVTQSTEGPEAIVVNSLAHDRCRFAELGNVFPEPCLYVLEAHNRVYAVDAHVREKDLCSEERFPLHQTQSWPVMQQLHHWLNDQLYAKHVKPNASLSEAIGYMLKHQKKLTLLSRER